LTEHRAELGQILVVAHQVGSDLCYWILVDSGKVIAHTMVQRVTKDDLEQPMTKQRMTTYELAIKETMDNTNHQIPMPPSGLMLEDVLDPNDEPEEDTKKESDDYMEEAYDSYLGAELHIPSGDTFILGRVIK